jgi:hypothetical protein
VNVPSIWLLLGPPGLMAGFGVAVAYARTNRRALAVFGLGFLAAAVSWAVVDILGGFEGDGYGDLAFLIPAWTNLMGWTLGAGFGSAIRLTRERRRAHRGLR